MLFCLWWVLVAVVWTVRVEMSSPDTFGSASRSLQALHCPPCERVHCSPRRALKLQCKGGVTTGVCGCCPTCAKLAGESCGGAWDYLGKCDQGLVCVYQDASDAKQDAERKGTCRSVLEVSEGDTCRPDCTWEFCQANPNEICSAGSVSVEKRECGGLCQHTTCSSCLVLKPPVCHQVCTHTDHVCLHHFGRCVQSHMELQKTAVCHQNLQSNSEGYFVCLTPACPK